MKTLLIFSLLISLYLSEFVIEKNTGKQINNTFMGCSLVNYGSYKKFFFVLSAGGFYECKKSGVTISDIIISDLHRKMYRDWYIWILHLILNNTSTLFSKEKENIVSFSNGYATLYPDYVVFGLYDYKSRKLQMYLRIEDENNLKGTYDVTVEEWNKYKSILSNNMEDNIFI